MSLVASRGRAGLLLGVVLIAGCGGASVEPSASATPTAAASLQPLTREEAIAAARRVAGASPSAVVASAEAGPFSQFEPNPNGKMSPPPADHWVWDIVFRESDEISRGAIIDYVTGALVETSIGITN
jgi:hypothetical protein